MQLRILAPTVCVLCCIVCIYGRTLRDSSKQHSPHTDYRSKRSLRERNVPSNVFTSFVLSGISTVKENLWERTKRSTDEDKPTAKSLDVVGRISSRFAETTVTSVMENTDTTDLEAEFELQIPETAFISSFIMIIDGKEYTANVKEKKEAQKVYDEAKEQNKTAGQISSKPRDQRTAQRGMEIFAVSVNIAARSAVRFELTYQQALERINNVYTYILSIRPRQVVETLNTNIYLYEPQGFTFLEWKIPGDNEWNQLNNYDRLTPMQTHSIKYTPDVSDQKNMDPVEGIDGDLIIEYDVNHENNVGLFVAEDGYFTHYFSPTELAPLKKNIVFVIDISGSMQGRKIEQTRDAMLTILQQLHDGDRFKIILFHSEISFWPEDDNEMIIATPDKIKEAQNFIKEYLVAGGGTNLNGGLMKGCKVLKYLEQDTGNMVVFLTDGQPTSGVTNPKKIQTNVRDETRQLISIHSLGFGYDLDYDLLKKISWMTDGYVQRIYEGQDANKQLEDFYKRISTPVLFNIEIEYDSNAVDTNSLSNHIFPQYYQGSEVVVVGKLKDTVPDEFDISIDAMGTSPISYAETLQTSTIILSHEGLPQEATNAIPKGFLEKFYVYMRIKELYKRSQIELGGEKAKMYHDEALQLALDYKLVTPLTSFVIVQEDQTPGLQEVSELDFEDLDLYVDYSYSNSKGASAGSVANAATACISIMFVLLYISSTFTAFPLT